MNESVLQWLVDAPELFQALDGKDKLWLNNRRVHVST